MFDRLISNNPGIKFLQWTYLSKQEPSDKERSFPVYLSVDQMSAYKSFKDNAEIGVLKYGFHGYITVRNLDAPKALNEKDPKRMKLGLYGKDRVQNRLTV